MPQKSTFGFLLSNRHAGSNTYLRPIAPQTFHTHLGTSLLAKPQLSCPVPRGFKGEPLGFYGEYINPRRLKVTHSTTKTTFEAAPQHTSPEVTEASRATQLEGLRVLRPARAGTKANNATRLKKEKKGTKGGLRRDSERGRSMLWKQRSTRARRFLRESFVVPAREFCFLRGAFRCKTVIP